MYSIRTPKNKSWFYPVRTNPHPFNIYFSAQVPKLPSELHQETRKESRDSGAFHNTITFSKGTEKSKWVWCCSVIHCVQAGNWLCLLVFPNSSPHDHLPYPSSSSWMPSLLLSLRCLFNVVIFCEPAAGALQGLSRAVSHSWPVKHLKITIETQSTVFRTPSNIYLFRGGVSWPQYAIFLRRDILSLRYTSCIYLYLHNSGQPYT
jgi:hypothetical protein